ncbi:hypothetical protein AAF712_002439 [Marasmius tenuissimus]|uniref:RING-type domain-containing protein n=1 Tax=Marasmius tenuissimus TaxID=585030 RepID=A0ABR3AAJ2_9AGAR
MPKGSATHLPRSSVASIEELSDPGQRIKTSSSSSHVSRSTHTRATSFHVLPNATPSSSQTKSHNKKEKGKDRVASHHSSRSSKYLSSEDNEAAGFYGPIAAAEFERMKKEIEDLKSTVHDQKKTIKKQNKRMEEMRVEVTAIKAARKEQETQLQVLSSKTTKHDELMSSLETTFQCQICMDLLTKPFALSPCGHVLCVSCLQDWFHKAPPSTDDMDMDPEDAEDPEYLLYRQKSCPCCRAIITRRPAPVFLIKNAVEAVKKVRASADTAVQRSESPLIGEEDPWEGLFPEEGGNQDEEDEEYLIRRYYADGLYIDSDSDGLESIMMTVDSGSESGEDGGRGYDDDEHGYQDAEDASDAESLEDPLFVKPSWEPEPPVDLYEREELSHLSDEDATMLRRGCTMWLIRTCHMEYSDTDGFVAYLWALNDNQQSYETVFSRTSAERNKRNLHRLYLGWILQMPFNEGLDEQGGKEFLIETLESYKTQPWKFHLDERPRGKMDLHVLVRADAPGYETPDSESYEW